MNTSDFGGIVLAAGKGRRMGGAKLRLTASGTSFLRRCTRTLAEGGVHSIVCVVGEDDAAWAAREVPDVQVVVNGDPSQGMLSSVKLGLAALGACEAAVIFPVDHPDVTASTVRALCGSSRRDGEGSAAVVKPAWRGRAGHPILVPARLLPKVAGAADDATLRGIIAASSLPVVTVAVEDPGILRNLNTPDDRERRERETT